MKDLFSAKWIKIAAAVLLVAAIAVSSSGVTYMLTRQELPESAAGQTIVTDNEAETDPFAEMTQNIKWQAELANVMSESEERRNAIIRIGESLKSLLSSDYSELLTNNTFNSGSLSVVISDYPLSEGRAIRKISYTVKTKDYDGTPPKEKWFFLQYLGDTTFFSDIEYLWLNEKEFSVFETTDGSFVFLTSGPYNYTNYNVDERVSNNNVKIYVPREGAFAVEEHVEIPMMVREGHSFQLIQEDDTIKAVIDGYMESPECIFNSTDLTFERSKGEAEGAPVDYDMPGLLLGLSDSSGNIRTLYIRKEDGRILSDEYAGEIIFSRKNKLFSLKHYTRRGESYGTYTNELGEKTEYQTGSIAINKLLCAPLGVDATADLDKIFPSELSESSNLSGLFYEVADIPLYVGEEYVCYIQNSYRSGGGTWRESPTHIRFDKLDDLSKFSYVDGDGWSFGQMKPTFNETTLAELVYGKKSKDLFQSELSTYGGTLRPYVDFTQLSLKRNLGQWSLMLPVMSEYFHPGNGSYSSRVDTFAVYSKDVPAFLKSEAADIGLGGWNSWEAKDCFGFPGSNAVQFQFDHFINICKRDYDVWDAGEYDITIPVELDESIVSISFADSRTQKMWTDELSESR